ncbi:NAD(P)H-dependent oxidoreductase [Leuconostocaceae bacterium ESL0723]|nr:NAD(P)H-dependent oxidoreductase [Lactobacillaceae bacterium L1_55_11]WEV53921.1 NAD(P)H-dependent oxidoreductase [Leuconostocaceae bacterium ESL0723]
MKVLVIYAYPNHTSYNYAILDQVKKSLGIHHEVQVLDLYEEDFNPTLFFDQEHRRHNLNQNEETAIYRDMISQADFLVFIYPIWWSGMPAILKGFIDRIFSKDFAYKYIGGHSIGLLKGKGAWIINTSDSTNFSANFLQQDYGQVLKKQILKMCGVKVQRHSRLNFLCRSTPDKREKFLDKVGRYGQRI